jgi:hypothetical protein
MFARPVLVEMFDFIDGGANISSTLAFPASLVLRELAHAGIGINPTLTVSPLFHLRFRGSTCYLQ